MKKGIYIAALLLFSALSSFTQTADSLVSSDSTKPKPRGNKFEIGINYAPEYADKRYDTTFYKGREAHGLNNQDRVLCDSILPLYHPGYSFCSGISFLIKGKKHLNFLTGLYVDCRTTWFNGFAWGNGIYWGYRVFRFNEYHRDQYLSMQIPFALDFSMFIRKDHGFRLHGNAGLLFDYNLRKQYNQTFRWWLNYSSISNESDFSHGYIDRFTFLYAGFTASIRAGYEFRNGWGFSLIPSVKYLPALFYRVHNSNWAPTPLIDRPYSFGCAFTVSFLLGKRS